MLIEAMIPLTVKFSTGDIRLTPGVPVELPTAQAQRLLVKAHGKVREVTRDWLAAWREVAELTSGLTADDPRLPIVRDALLAWDDALQRGNWVAFRKYAAQVRSAMVGEKCT
jgi:hypothetical protein